MKRGMTPLMTSVRRVAIVEDHGALRVFLRDVLTRLGWKFNTLKPGDKVTLLINPLKSGQAGGMLHEATLSDGRKLSDGNPPGGSFDR